MKILVTAGPTREPIDAVRFISNHSSGHMGLALASVAKALGHSTTLLLASAVHHADERSLSNTSSSIERFDSVAQLKQRLTLHWPNHDVLIMAAAVADYRPRTIVEGKLRRLNEGLTVRLEPTPDLVAMMAAQKRPDQTVIAFALEEPMNLEQQAVQKLHRKGVDAIVANPLVTLGDKSISPLWLTADGRRQEPGRMAKTAFAQWLLREIEAMRTAESGDSHQV